MAECAVLSGAGAEKGAPRETDTAAAAGLSEENGRSGGNGRSGTADASENGGASDRDGGSVGHGALYGHGASDGDGVSVGHGVSVGDGAEHATESDRIIREYEKIAFADASLGEIKVSDKLRALDQYRAMCERRSDGGEISLVVNYDYGE